MASPFSPAKADVERYLRLRQVREKLSVEIASDIPERAHDDIGEALGIFRNRTPVIEGSTLSKTMAECCLYDWYRKGKNLVQRYAATYPAQPGTDEHYVLDAMCRAQFRLLSAESLVPGSGAHCQDLITGEPLFVMDIAMSRNTEAGFMLAGRTVSLGEYWMTTGAGLPVTSSEVLENARRHFKKRGKLGIFGSPADLPLAIVRACLDAGAADQVLGREPPEPAQPFSPAREDVDRYLRLRAVSHKLCNEMVRHVPKPAFDGIAEAIGILRDGVLVFDSEDMTGVLADCCVYDWYEDDGTNVVQRYAQAHPSQPGTDERYLLDAYLQAEYRVLRVDSVAPGAGVWCTDVLQHEEIFVMDRGLSQSAQEGFMIATRTIPLGKYWMTSGAGLPMPSREEFDSALQRIERGPIPKAMEGPGRLSLLMVRACLDAGGGERIEYQDIKPKRREPRHITRRNRKLK